MPDRPADKRYFADPAPGADETRFSVDNSSAQYYDSPYYKLHLSQVLEVPKPRTHPPILKLEHVWGHERVQQIIQSGQIAFHAVGDTGAARHTGPITEAHVADAMAAEFKGKPDSDPAFLYLLGDLIYNFGEDQYYYDQFYEPFRAYRAPIFAIPGNHDGVVYSDKAQSLAAFVKNFCAEKPVHPVEAGNLLRTSMTQPGVYFTLEAPFLSIVGLYSNVLEGPGVISSKNGRFPKVGDDQKTFLESELKRLKAKRGSNDNAVIVAVHHPPYSADSVHGGSTGLVEDLDEAFNAAGLWPDAVLSGHAHLYQRFMRTLPGGAQIPYMVSGSGGYNVARPASGTTGVPAKLPLRAASGDHSLVQCIREFGYMRIAVAKGKLKIVFNSASRNKNPADTCTMDLKKRRAGK